LTRILIGKGIPEKFPFQLNSVTLSVLMPETGKQAVTRVRNEIRDFTDENGYFIKNREQKLLKM